MERELLLRGYTPADERDASVVILNTCTVTAAADRDARSAIRRVHRQNPAAKILVTGCYAQRAPEQIAQVEGVTWVVGNSHKAEVADIVTRAGGTANFVPMSALTAPADAVPQLLVGDIFAHTEVMAAPVMEGGYDAPHGRTRANLKVQDGCDNRCSFCVIPFVRGGSRSLHTNKVLEEAHQLVQSGYRELVLSGINLGRWGRDLSAGQRLADLIHRLLRETSIEKIRLSSVEPMDWTDDLIRLLAEEPRIAKHAHVPLQSGSDTVLRRMHRKYRPWHYEARIHAISQSVPDAAIGADVMVGFPGESDLEFQETYDLIARLPFTYLHVFTFSARPGTAAAEMPGQVPIAIAKERNAALRKLIADKNREFRQRFVGKGVRAITLNTAQGTTEALSDNFVRITISEAHAPNQWLPLQITGLTADGWSAVLQ